MHRPVLAFVLVLGAFSLEGCGVEDCRFDPLCGGGIGGLCDTNDDCQTGFCCMETSNCNGGMCTYECDSSSDCPDDMRCEHHVCFYACATDADCADGMSCEHGQTICEWP